MKEIQTQSYSDLVANIGQTLKEGRSTALRAVNTSLVATNWKIGQHIVEFEQYGKERAVYGDNLLNRLSHDLTLAYGKGFSRSNVAQIRQFYLRFPKIQTLSGQLSWSHYVEILKAEDELAIQFYAKQCEKESWSVRELKRQMKSCLYERLALSRDKEAVLTLSKDGLEVATPQDIVKDPFVLEFVGIQQNVVYKEGDLEQRLIENLEEFLMELGKGFTFVGRQYRINIGNRHFYVDLVFYHRILKCFVLIDLKRGEIEHNDIGQMNMYLSYFKEEEGSEGDNEPIGIVLGRYKDQILVKYAMQGITNQLFVSRYQLYLPDKEQLQQELSRLLENE